jgi:Histone deacetylase domain
LYEELLWDAAVMQHAAEQAKDYAAVYALGTHPGHHAGVDSFGGYCYVNHAALVAKLLQQSQQQQQDESKNPSSSSKVAILDVDYVSIVGDKIGLVWQFFCLVHYPLCCSLADPLTSYMTLSLPNPALLLFVCFVASLNKHLALWQWFGCHLLRRSQHPGDFNPLRP